MKKIMNQKNLLKFFIIFIILQPIIDIYILFDWRVVSFFRFSPATIIRMVFMAILSIWALLTIKVKKKHLWILGYCILVVSYLFLHHINATSFTSKVPDNFSYSIKEELFYIIRLLIPLVMIVISYYQKFTFKQFKLVINSLIVLISGSIVVTNILKISLGSYNKVPIKGTILSWFTSGNEYNFMDLASKGFFNDPNRISALMVLLTPLMIYIFIKECNKKQFIVLFIHMLAMIMIGTKVASLGFIILLSIIFVVYLYMALIKKEYSVEKQIIYSFVSLVIMFFVIFPFSPMVNRIKVDRERGYIYEENGTYEDEQREIGEIKNKTKEEIIGFIENSYKRYSINDDFILKSYSYKYDPEFWLGVMETPLMERTNYRQLEEKIWLRIKEVNNNSNDTILGLTFSRLQKTFDLERDFVSHSYSLGIAGVMLFLSPYILICLICGLYMLYKYKEKFILHNLILIISVGITIFAGFYSGNVMDGLVVTIVLGFICGQLIRNVFNTEDELKEEKGNI